MTRQYFGTDGIRGRVGVAPMTPDFVMKLGWAAGTHFRQRYQADGGGRAKVLIGKDTRLSGYLLESALEAGFAAAGVDVLLLGPMPTPAIAYLTHTFRAAAGVVVSASHNPHYDNGVKFFGSNGRKLADAEELAIERGLESPIQCVEPEEVGRARRIDDAPGRYIEFCKGTFRANDDLRGLRIVIDCSNGASYHVAGPTLRELGADVTVIGDEPDGFNINAGCGSQDLALLKATVTQQRADLGIALDGDGDRCIMVDHSGQELDGDQLLYIVAKGRHRAKKISGPVVGTLMSNLALEQGIQSLGMDFVRANVGDRYVMELLDSEGGTIGGESSGHLVCLDRHSTGDGLVSALQILAEIRRTGRTLAELASDISLFPQVLINVRVSGNAKTLVKHDAIQSAAAETTRQLGDTGRVLLRASGTEPLIRVMVEGQDAAAIQAYAESLADQVREITNQPPAGE